MELRPDTSHKENVAPRPATPTRPGKRLSGSRSEVAGPQAPPALIAAPITSSFKRGTRQSSLAPLSSASTSTAEQRRLRKSLGVGLGSGHGRWVPMCQAKRGGPAATPSPGAVLCQEPCRVQTNLASPSPGLGLALKDTTGQLINSGFWQQSNLQRLARRPQRRAPRFAVQQSNLSMKEATLAECGSHTSPQSEPQESVWPHMMPQAGSLPRGPLAPPSSSLRPSQPLATDTRCPDFRPAADYAPLGGHTRPGPRSWCGLGSWTSRLMGEPLTLEDLAVPTQSQPWAPPKAAVHQLLASVQHLEHKAAGLRCRASREPLGPVWQEPWTSDGQALPACLQPSQAVPASWDKRRKFPPGLRETEDSPETPGVRAGLSDSQAGSKPASPETTVGMLTGDVLDPEQGVLPAHPLRRGGNCSPGTVFGSGQRGDPLLPRGAGSREPGLCSSAFSHAARGVLPGWEGGEGAPQEQVSRKEERMAPCPPGAAPARSGLQVEAGGVWEWELGGSGRPAASSQEFSLQAGCHYPVTPPSPERAALAGRLRRGCPVLLLLGLRAVSCPLISKNKARSTVSLASETARWRLLSRCFRAWQHVVQTRRAVVAALALGRRQLLRRGLRALRWALWLREAQLEVAWGRHTQALLARSFRKWRNLTWQQKQGQPHVQAGPGPPSSGEGQGQGPVGRKPVLDHAGGGSSFLQGMRRRMLQRILRRWRLRAWGPGTPSGSTRTPSAPEPLGGIPGWEASLGCSTQGSSLEEASRAPALLESLGGSLPWAAGQQQGRCQQPRGAVRWHQSPLQRRILLGWSRWAAAQGAQRELAVRWAWARSCRATLGLWRRRLAQWQEAEQWARERGRRRVREALCRWRSRWQRQQFLHQKYQRWVQVHLQGLRRAVFQGWQQATARRRHMVAEPEQLLLQSHFQAWCGVVRDTGVLQAKCRAFQDGLRRRALRAAFVTWQESRVAAAWAQEQRVTRASIAHWRRCAQGGRADRQLRKAQAHQAFTSWRVALGQRREARQQAEEGARAQAWVALCWTLWVRESRLHRLSRAHAARKLSARVLEAWARSAAQGRVQRATISQFQQAGPRHLLRTHWAQWQTALLRVRLEPPSRAREASTAHPRPRSDLRHWPSLASRGCLLVVIDAAAPWQQTHSCSPQATGPMLPGSTQHHSLCGQSKPREMAWAQSQETCPWGHMSEVQGDREPPLCHSFQLWLHWPGHSSWTPNRLPTGPGGGCSSETGTLKGKGEADNQRRLGRKYLQRWQLEALLRRLQGTQQARRLAVTWQRWVDAQGAEQLARTLLLQWHLRWAWRTWRRWVLRLRVAQRLQQQGDGWVLSQAFEKWQQHLAARDLMRGATGSPRPLSKPAIRSPGSRLEAAQAPECAGRGAEQGAQLQL
nr:uncharacterized protein C1orf167 homolog isoform X1 [Equus caballus]